MNPHRKAHGWIGSFKPPPESVRRLNQPPRLRPAEAASRHFLFKSRHGSITFETEERRMRDALVTALKKRSHPALTKAGNLLTSGLC